MPTYVPDPSNSAEPIDGRPAGTAAAEFRALKALVASLVIAAASGPSVRQAIQSASIDQTTGQNNAITTGAGLRPGLSATATPYQLSYAGGFSGGKPLDYAESINADVADILGADLKVNNTSFLYRDYGVAWGQCLTPPQYGSTYDRTRFSALQFAGAAGSTVFLDDGGMSWTAQGGAKVQTNQFKFGTGALGGGGAANALNGTTDFIKTANFTSFGDGSWYMRGWAYTTALPGVGLGEILVSGSNAGTFGASIGINNNAGTIKFAYWLSSNGTAHDIASAVQGITTPVINTWYYVELTYDALAGIYRFYINGTQESSTASASKICAVTNLSIGALGNSSSFFTGYIDKPDVRVGVCDHPNGTAYAVPTGAPAITDHKINFFSIPKHVMYEVTGASTAANTDPVMTAKTRLFCAEADTSGVAITAVRNYAIRGRYRSVLSPIPATNSITPFSDNIGTKLKKTRVIISCITAVNGDVPGADHEALAYQNSSPSEYTSHPGKIKDRNTTSVITSNGGFLIFTMSGAAGTPAAGSGPYMMTVEAERSF